MDDEIEDEIKRENDNGKEQEQGQERARERQRSDRMIKPKNQANAIVPPRYSFQIN